MSVAAQKLTRDHFRALYAQRKPYFELLDGEAAQKPVPTRFHSTLQFVLSVILKELGFKSRAGTDSRSRRHLGADTRCLRHPRTRGGSYPTPAVAVAIEVLSPDDRFTRVIGKCRKCAEWGVQDILVHDPAGREAWYWDTVSAGLMRTGDIYRFRSRHVELIQSEVFRRFDEELGRL